MKTTSFPRTLLLVLALLAAPAACYAQAWGVGVSIGIAPPPLPIYVQPPCPAVGYLWTPGYWAYEPEAGYYWVPGTWVLAPAPGLLWTPGYWGFEEGFYAWHAGYWGPRVGFYGGINYGFGYFGSGFEGGHWDRGAFLYNRSVTNVSNVSITNVYNAPVVNNRVTNGRTSFNGPGGIQVRPSAGEQAAARAPHYGATAEQQRHDSTARALPALRASVNRGQPPVAATPRPGVFGGHDGRAAQGRDTAIPRGPSSATVSHASAVPGRAPSERPPFEAPRAQRATAAPSYSAQAPMPRRESARPPFDAARAQRAAPGPSYSAQAPMPHRETVRAPAFAAPHGGGNAEPMRRNPPAHANDQGPHRPDHG